MDGRRPRAFRQLVGDTVDRPSTTHSRSEVVNLSRPGERSPCGSDAVVERMVGVFDRHAVSEAIAIDGLDIGQQAFEGIQEIMGEIGHGRLSHTGRW